MKFVRSRMMWTVLLVCLALGGILTLPGDGTRWLLSWALYSLFLVLGSVGIYLAWRLTGSNPQAGRIALVAFLLRLVIGVTLMEILPVVGYQDNEATQAGYFYKDAYFRDQQAWEVAHSDDPLWKAFSGKYVTDQYGGMMALSASIYRYISPDVQRPFLILILAAAAAAIGTLFLWKATRDWFGDSVAHLAAWIFALYPEAVILGSTHMREAFVLPAVALTCFCLTSLRGRITVLVGWLLSAGILILFSPPSLVIAFVLLIGWWLLEPGRRISWKQLALLAGVLLVGVVLIIAVWSRLPSLQGKDPLDIISTFLRYNTHYQFSLATDASAVLRRLSNAVGPRWQPVLILGYGAAQPLLPAALLETGSWFWRLVGTLRGMGWYALLPLLIYGTLACFRAPVRERRWQLVWLNVVLWAWLAVSAFNAGADQWDNPRYRAILLAWQALSAAWAWEWGRDRRDPWLKRLFAVEAVFLLLVAGWYAGRYLSRSAILDSLVVTVFILVGGIWIFVGYWGWRRKLWRR